MSEKYKDLKVKDLQELLQKLGAPHTGKKEELIERLVKHDETKALELDSLEEEFGKLEEFDESKLNLGELDDPATSELNDPEEKPKDNKPAETNTGPITKEGSGFTFNPIVFDKIPTAETTSTTAAKDIERRIERAKRFGVQVNEKTKQELRAERFGVQNKSAAQDEVKTLPESPEEEEKKRKRAERFDVDANKKPKN